MHDVIGWKAAERDAAKTSWGTKMRLSAPTHQIFYVSVVLFVLALIGTFVAIPFVSLYAFWLAVAAYVVLAAGNLLKGM